MTPEPIFQVASGFMAAKHLFVANELGVLTHLAAGPATLDDLAQRAGIPRRTLCMLVDAIAALGFVERQGARSQNGPVAATFVSGRTPRDLRSFLHLWDHLSYPKWTTLAAVCRTDDMAFEEVDFTEAEQQLFSEGVEAIQAAPAQMLPGTYDFGRHRRLLDLGGGTGSWLVAVLRQYIAALLAGMLLADQGATVIKVERLQGDPDTITGSKRRLHKGRA